MRSRRQSWSQFPSTFFRAETTAAARVLLLAVVLSQAVQAQTFTVIHTFTGGADGSTPINGLTMDAAGHFYGTTPYALGCGTVFTLNRFGSAWVMTPILTFATDGSDGCSPFGRVVVAQDGTLYGTTGGGGGYQWGTVFHLSPPQHPGKSARGSWDEEIIYRFTGGSDGGFPQGDLTFDQSGNLYGTTETGGFDGNGVIYELTPSGGGWSEAVLYSPQGDPDGNFPLGGVIHDTAGNLDGVFGAGGFFGQGAIYQLSQGGSGWTEQILHSFSRSDDGAEPIGGLIIDSLGDLYGTTQLGGSGGGGTIFKLPPASTFTTLYSFSDLFGPQDKLIMDPAGNLYGTTLYGGAYGAGSVFKLTPSNGGWTYTSLHDFTGGSDGALPISNVVFDASGNIYGTASQGGSGCDPTGCGVVWEITP